MWGSYDFIAAENIDGVNSVLWKVGDDDYAYYWLRSLHNDEWDYFGSGDVGWEGDPEYGDLPDAQFYKERNLILVLI